MLTVFREIIAASRQLRGTYLYAFLVPVAVLVIGGFVILNSLEVGTRSSAFPVVLGLMIVGIIASFLFTGWIRSQEIRSKKDTFEKSNQQDAEEQNLYQQSATSFSAKPGSVVSGDQIDLSFLNHMDNEGFVNLTLTERNNLIDYLSTTSLADGRDAQISLCQQIGLKWNNLRFIGETPNTFSARLINYLNENQKVNQLNALFLILKKNMNE